MLTANKTLSINRRTKSRGRYLAMLISAVILVTVGVVLPTKLPLAAEESTEITGEIGVTVGYDGAKAYLKKTVLLADLVKDAQIRWQIYTWIDARGACGTTEAEGIYLSDLIKNAEIDADSIYAYQFLAEDVSDGSQKVINKISDQDLYDAEAGERYTLSGAFRYALGSYQNCDDKEDYEKNPDDYYTIRDIFGADGKKEYTDGAWRLRGAVMPMLALKTKSSTWTSQIVPPTDLGFHNLNAETGPVFLYGQATKSDINQPEKISAVSQVQILFEGSPEISVKGENLEGKAGSKGKVSVSVSTPDSTLTDKIRSEIGFVSSNESVATVDEDGNVILTGNGTASILVTYDSDGDGTAETIDTVSVKSSGSNSDSSGSSKYSGSQENSSTSGGSSDGSSGNNLNGGSGSDTSGNADDNGTNRSSGNGTDADQFSGASAEGTVKSTDFTPRSTTVTNTTPNKTTTGTASGIANNTTGTDSANPRVAGETAAEGYETDLDDGTAQKAFEVDGDEAGGSGGTGTVQHKTLLMILGGAVALVGGMAVMTYYYISQTEEKVLFKRMK